MILNYHIFMMSHYCPVMVISSSIIIHYLLLELFFPFIRVFHCIFLMITNAFHSNLFLSIHSFYFMMSRNVILLLHVICVAVAALNSIMQIVWLLVSKASSTLSSVIWSLDMSGSCELLPVYFLVDCFVVEEYE